MIFKKDVVSKLGNRDSKEMTQPIVLKGEYSEAENPHCAKPCAFSDISVLPPDDQQALQTIISIWPTLAPEAKIGILQAIESERLGRC